MRKLFPISLILSLILVIVLSNGAFAGQAEEKLNEGINLYKQGAYAKSAKVLEEVSNSGYYSAELYYNLGNSYYRMGKFPLSILNFERAKRLSPDDDDINFNLNVAQLKTIDKIEPVPRLFLSQWWEGLRSSYSSAGWAKFTVAFVWILLASLTAFFWTWQVWLRKALAVTFILSGFITFFSVIFTIQQSNLENNHDEAIVFAQTVNIKSSPDNTAIDLFVLHEGTKVKILDEVGDWRKIRLANGSLGWMESKAIVVI